MEILHTLLISVLILSSLFVFISDNPVHSVLFLIFSLCNAAIILFLFNVEFLALIFIIVYVGAIAVLFLFVVMMLNVKIVGSELINFYFPIIVVVGSTLFFQIFIGLERVFSNFNNENTNFSKLVDNLTNIDIIGQALYNYYSIVFLLAGFILLVAMIGAICLTLNFSSARKNELTFRQLSRSDTFLTFFNVTKS